MSISITGMEMPKRGMVVNIYADGRVTNHFDEFGKTIGKAVPVPPHGRLIDADALLNLLNHCMFPSDMVTTVALGMATNWIKEAPTVIEAEDGE